MPPTYPGAPALAEQLIDPVCVLAQDGVTLLWSNASFIRTFQCRRAKRLDEAVGPELFAALAPLVKAPVRGWTEVQGKERSGEALVFAAQAQAREQDVVLLLRDNSSEARLHESYRATLAKERERQRELEQEVARRIREHEDDLSQFSEIAQLGADVVIGFLEEARAQVARVMTLLGTFRAGTAMSAEDVSALLRALHTLKGNSRSMGLNLLGGRTHHAEELLLPLRQNPLFDAERVGEATQILRELDRLIDRASDLHQRLASASGGEVISRTRALIRLCDAVKRVLGTGAPSELSGLLAPALEEAEATVAVPAQNLVTGAARTVTVAAKELKKLVDVRTVLRGEVELRREVAQVLESALGHLARNAVAHAIEMPERRHELGKPRSGLVTISSELDSSGLRFSVEDDGAGIEPAKVLAAAKARGLLPKEQTELTVEEAVAVLMRPGFTTASEVTTVSGRGVGLDAVDEMVRTLGGALQVRSTPGQGSAFVVSLPQTAVVKKQEAA
jgi:chemotaxis protein histidine kinase CheA